MIFRKIIFSVLVMLFAGFVSHGQPVVKAVIDGDSYKVGDLIDVDILVDNNEGLHGLYFDLEYDSSVLEFERLVEGSLIRRIVEDNELFYARSDDVTSASKGAHLITSYTLKGSGKETNSAGTMVKLYFRVKGQGTPGAEYGFNFNACDIKKGDESSINGVSWLNSESFTIENPNAGAYVLIKEPFGNQVFDTDVTGVNLICTDGNYKVVLLNSSNNTVSEFLDVQDGKLLNEQVTLTHGFNEIEARLFDASDYDPADPDQKIVAFDRVIVYRTNDDKYVKIKYPFNHELINSNMVEVEISSSYTGVSVNGLTLTTNGQEDEENSNNQIYTGRIWLKEGFNTLTARSKTIVDGKEIVYTDEVQVFYHKDRSIFSLVTPLSNTNFKPSEYSKLMIKGEISDLYKSPGDNSGNTGVENNVTLKVIYTPSNRAKKQQILVDNKRAKITDSDYSLGQIHTNYMFYNDFDIPLEGLENGEIEIIAYKNKEGAGYDNAIHRICYIDNNRLWIDLVQPNVYTSDELDSYARILNYNEQKNPGGDGNINISDTGTLELASLKRSSRDEGLTNVTDMIEAPDNSLYAVVNDTLSGKMEIFRKSPGQSEWISLVAREGIYGYKLCYTNSGILLGALNFNSTANSGLYLLEENNSFTNLSFDEGVINDIPFIENRNGRIYFYKDYSQYLYSFNVFALERQETRLVVPSLTKEVLDISHNISQFVLSEDASSIAITTDNNEVFFYSKDSYGFSRFDFTAYDPAVKGYVVQSVFGKHIVQAEYQSGDYITYLIVKNDQSVEVVMKNKISGDYIRKTDIDLTEAGWLDYPLHSVGYNNDFFILLYKNNDKYYAKRGQVFFDSFYPAADGESLVEYPATYDLPEDFRLFVSHPGSLYAGIGTGTSSDRLYSLYSDYQPNGEITFNYVNSDVDNITGFSFEVPGILLDESSDLSGLIQFGFQVKELSGYDAGSAAGDAVLINHTRASLLDLINNTPEGSAYSVSKSYDALNDHYVIHVELNTPAGSEDDSYQYLVFDYRLESMGTASPSISGLTVYKKIKAKICMDDSGTIVLPIQGYVYDRTVKEVLVAHSQVPVEAGGAFYYNYEVRDYITDENGRKTVPVEISCKNGIGDTARIKFDIEIIDSRNDVKNVKFKFPGDISYEDFITGDDTPVSIDTTSDTVKIYGEYFGMTGMVVGYELYDYVTIDNMTALKLLESKLLTTVRDDEIYTDLSTYGSGYEAGYFIDHEVKLNPGRQKLVVYCENPGGKRTEYMAGGAHPEINYNMDPDQQRIIFNIDATTDEVVNNVAVINALDVELFEEAGTDGFLFTGEYDISGEIKSNIDINSIRVKSLTEGLVFEGGESEITVNTETGNRFKVKFKASLTGNVYKKDFYLAVIPDPHMYVSLKRGVKISARKSYKDTRFIPGFSPINPDNWTEEQQKDVVVPFRVELNRNDFPIEGTVYGTFTLNHENIINGRLEPVGGGLYELKDENNSTKKLTRELIKPGKNRVMWLLEYLAPGTDSEKVIMSYSNSGKEGMADYIFTYSDETVINPTVISFSQDLTDSYYDGSTLPALTISKDKTTITAVLLNGVQIFEDDGTTGFLENTDEPELLENISLTVNADAVKEGKNSLEVVVTEKTRSAYSKKYTFLYDTADPVVTIDSYTASSDYTRLLSLTAGTTEANYSKAFLYYNGNVLNIQPELIIRGDGKYELVFTDLEVYNIEPEETKPVQVRVIDMAGRSGFSEEMKGFAAIDRPAETLIKEKNIGLPLNSTDVTLPNQTKEFQGHTKFAPPKFQKRAEITSGVARQNNYLISTATSHHKDPVYWSKMESYDNLINAEIRDENNLPVITQDSVSHWSTGGKFGQALIPGASATDSMHYFTFKPFGDKAVSSKGTLSLYTGISTEDGGNQIASFKINIGNNISLYSVDNYIEDYTSITCGTQTETKGVDISGLRHVYMVWDYQNGLSGGKTLQIWLDGVLYASLTDTVIREGDISIQVIARNHYTSFVYLDNLKVWDYVVSENPNWQAFTENEETALQPDNLLEPEFWSNCDTVENFTTPQVLESGFTPETSGSWTGVGGGLDGGNLLQSYMLNGDAYLYPFGNISTAHEKVTLAFDMSVITAGWGKAAFNIGNVEVAIVDHQSASSPYTNFYLTVGGVTAQSITSSAYRGGMHKLYLVIDSAKGLKDGKSVRVFYDNAAEDILSTTVDVDLTGVLSFHAGAFDTRSGYETTVKFDNIKIWNTIVSEDPNNLYGSSEDTSGYKPVYWSRCETEAGLTTGAEIKDEDNLPVTVNSDGLHNFTEPGVEGSAFWLYGRAQSYGAHYYNLYPVSQSRYLDKGALMFYGKVNRTGTPGQHSDNGEILVNVNDIHVGIRKEANERIEINFGTDQVVIPADTDNWHRYYLVWDSGKGLSGSMSFKLYQDSSLIYESNQDIQTGTTAPVIQMGGFTMDGGGYYGYAYIDEIKLWDSVVSENPDNLFDEAERNYLNGSGKYVVFKVAKSAAKNITAASALEAIVFRTVGQYWDSETNSSREILPLTDSTDYPLDYKLVTGDDYIYLLVDKQRLLDKFNDEKSNFLFDLAAGGYNTPYDPVKHVILDPGSLRIEYPAAWGVDFAPAHVYLVGDGAADGDTYDDIIVYDSRYEDNAAYNENYEKLHPDLEIPLFENNESETDRTFFHSVDSTDDRDVMTIGFWFRPEDEYINEQENKYDNQFHRVFTFNTETDALLSLGYRGKEALFEKNGSLLETNTYLIATSFIPEKNWALVYLTADRDQEKVTLSIKDDTRTVEGEVEMTPEEMDIILAEGASYFFGPSEGEEYRTGFYSVARPFIINRALTSPEIERLFTLRHKSTGPNRDFRFNGLRDNQGSGEGELENIFTDVENDLSENAVYLEAAGGGSYRAASEHRNYLRVREDNSSNRYVIFDDARSPVKYNADFNGGANGFTITPGNGRYGYYYFGDRTGNYGLEKDRYYSVSGEVLSLDAAGDAKLILRINGKEESFTLKQGRFTFVFDYKEEVVPTDVKLYIVTDSQIELSNNMIFNRGNFTLPEASNIPRSAVRTNFAFDLSGTVSLWYKPFIADRDGSAAYDTVIFDSELIKIGTYGESAFGDRKYYFIVKKDSQGTVLKEFKTEVKVTHRWQHLQISYNKESDVIYAYVDGNIAAKHEGGSEDLNIFGSMAGTPSEEPNVYIGCDEGRDTFAEGFIDKVYIDKYYHLPLYNDTDYNGIAKENILPASIVYNNETGDVILQKAQAFTGVSFEDVRYVLESLDSGEYWYGTTESFDILAKNAGRYRVTFTAAVNGSRFKEILMFTIDEKPKFEFLKDESTPIVFMNKSKDVVLKFRYDNSYVFENQQLLYPGLAVKLEYHDGTALKAVYKYITKDFRNQDMTRWICGSFQADGSISWTELAADNGGKLNLQFPGIVSTTEVSYETKNFYFKESFASDDEFENNTNPADISGLISIASIYDPQVISDSQGREYKLVVSMIDNSSDTESQLTADEDIFKNSVLEYTIRDAVTSEIKQTGTAYFNASGTAELYYDDILPGYGRYDCSLILKYLGIEYSRLGEELNWAEPKQDQTAASTMSDLEIVNFDLLYIDTEQDMAKFYLEYDEENTQGDLIAKLEIIKDGRTAGTYSSGSLSRTGSQNYHIFKNIYIGKGKAEAKVTLTAKGYVRDRIIRINNDAQAPELVLTNWVDSYISYNNVYFSWKGLYDGIYNGGIKYSYNFDNAGWSSTHSRWRDVRFYNLDEGYHTFKVKAVHNEIESNIRSVTFFVDIKRPQFDPDKISYEKLYDSEGVFYAVNIKGQAGAVTDISLQELYADTQKISFQEDGSFEVLSVPLTIDGINSVVLTAYDKVGNKTSHTVEVENAVTTILYPTEMVKYSPLTVVGKIDDQISAGMNIYLFDPRSEDRGEGDYSGWKKAKINADRTFFVEDVYINPGSMFKEVHTVLKMAVVFDSGKVFEKEINLKAKTITMPIEMELSTHAAEGEDSDTYVKIECQANISGISSWSIDYNGDGVYDLVDLVDNPDSSEAKTHVWEHKYSSLGLVTPKVRVVTTDGNFFSVSDRLIIHEKIKEASNKMIAGPVSLSAVSCVDGSKRVFVLAGTQADGYAVEVYKIGRNDAYLSNKEFEIQLGALGINNPVVIRAVDKDHLIIGANVENGDLEEGIVYQLKANQFGNYIKEAEYSMLDAVKDLAVSEEKVLVTHKNLNYLVEVLFNSEGIMDTENVREIKPELHNSIPLSNNLGITRDSMGVLIADYFNQRVVRLSNTMSVLDQFGGFGEGEGQFLKPALVKSFDNRIFVFDEARGDIQVFDQLYKPVCTLKYNLEADSYNYLAKEFFTDIADMDIVTKEEGSLLYYYALVLSKSTGKLAMLRLPQWEELRARVRNNKIVFIKNGEIFTAKPDGSDLNKILSSDAIPRVEGTLDYPALSPDGKNLVFTSRIRLYNGVADSADLANGGSQYAYDNLYTYNIETKALDKINPGQITGYEIERPVFNSNGDKIIFSAKQSGEKWQIYTYSFDSLVTEKLFDSVENVRFPYYSPDDRFVVFTTDYDGDEEIEIVDTENLDMRVSVTSNFARDSYPVWNTVYPFEISSQDLKIESKIAFVSERRFHKGIHFVYVARPSDSDIRIVKMSGQDIGGDPDSAAIEVTDLVTEGDYPCFTGDGASLVFEYFDGETQFLKKFDFVKNADNLKKRAAKEVTDAAYYSDVLILDTMDIAGGNVIRPAGMKNMIANFVVENRNGNEVQLNWDRYTDNDIFYTVQFRVNKEGEPFVEKKVSSQSGTLLKGLEMGMEYLVRVCIMENGQEAASTQWKKIKMPDVVAIPSYTIDENNPYVVKLHAWKPDEQTTWNYAWIIDNAEIPAGVGQDMIYHFAVSGTKTIVLKASTADNDAVNYSEPMEVKIVSDIEPVIQYTVSEDAANIHLNAGGSRGENIDFSKTLWQISGPDGEPLQLPGSNVSVPLRNYKHKLFVTLTLKRKMVNRQAETDTLQKEITIDLDYQEIKPVITYENSSENSRMVQFSAEQSKGNIDWMRARWFVYSDNALIYSIDGVSTFDYLFPETNNDTVYSVSLTLPRKNDGKTETVSQIVAITAKPIEPVIDYEVLELKEEENVIGAKLLLDCTKSMGSGIDYSQARWSVAAASDHGEQATQYGPTAIYNMSGFTLGTMVEVALTMSRKNGDAPVTVTKWIKVDRGEIPEAKMTVNEELEETSTGQAIILDVLKSTGPNINWEKTEWLIDGQYTRRGPSVRYDIPASAEKTVFTYVCTLYRNGGQPETKTGRIDIKKQFIYPVISANRLSGSQKNVYELSVLDTEGVNIDWERTDWFIHDGNENVIQKRGAKISHAFALKSDQMGYPVMAEIYLKGSSYPYVAYTTIDVEADELLPIIGYDSLEDDPNTITFSAAVSKGSNIDWQQTRWTFGDSSEAQYGPTAVHKYPLDSSRRSYKVTLTLIRRSANGSTETKTATKEIRIGADDIKPIIKVVEKKGDYLVLSAEDSEGRGLMLDRSIWLFEGAGDNTSYSQSTQSGTVSNSSSNTNVSVGAELGIQAGNDYVKFSTGLSVNYSTGSGTSTTSYNDYKNTTNSYSSANQHHGAVCRRYLKDEENKDVTSIAVTLLVYRVSSDGSVRAETVSTTLNIADAVPGKTYGD